MFTSPPAPIASFRFDDAQEQASVLTGWNQAYLQLSPGSFRGEISQIQGSGIRLFLEQVQQSVYQTGALANNVLAIGVPLETEGTGVFCGSVCGPDSFHVFSGQSGFEFRSSRKHTMLGIELKLDKTFSNSSLLQGARAVVPSLSEIAEVRAYLLSLFRAAKLNPALLATPAVMAIVADYLLDRMDHFGTEGEPHQDVCAHWELVQKACALANEQWEAPLTVAQLCHRLDVSRRTLQNGFQRVLDVSPLSYLKALRLGQARNLLKKAHTVTDAATACGFWHFGHFSQDYQSMFGERPSDTLRDHARM